MKVAYFDCFSGISGDMLLGALIDAGADIETLRSSLKLLPCADEFELEAGRVTRHGISGIDVTVADNHEHVHGHEHAHGRNYIQIAGMINASGLSKKIKHEAKQVFLTLAQAEAKVHGSTVEQVHFHEVGAVDSIVDIVGSVIALNMLGVEAVFASPINVGGGTVKAAHGVLPVPAPATARLLCGLHSYGGRQECGELATPTGAAVIKALGRTVPEMPRIQTEACGYGFGKRDTGSLNALRVLIGEMEDESGDVYIVETNIDDMSAEAVAYAADEIRQCNALDVYQTPIAMKKGRQGVILSAMCNGADLDVVIGAMLVNTSSLGVRYYKCGRTVLQRRVLNVNTRFGAIRVKESVIANGRLRHKPEFDDCALAAKKFGVPLETVYSEAMDSIGK